MNALTDFLLARIAEDEATARAASPGPWHVNVEQDTVLAVDDIEVCDGFALSGPQLRATTAHIARHDPARVLAECEAKRRIVLSMDDILRAYDREPESGDEVRDEAMLGAANVAEDVLRNLASVYADHADYVSNPTPAPLTTNETREDT